jgi:HEAT repeat protein
MSLRGFQMTAHHWLKGLRFWPKHALLVKGPLNSGKRLAAWAAPLGISGVRISETGPLAIVCGLVLMGPCWSGDSREDARIGGRTKKAWIASLRDDDPRVRLQACEALGLLGPAADEAVPELTRTATDPNEPVRRAALLALGEMREKSAAVVPLLISALLAQKEFTYTVRLQEAIARIGGPAVPHLIEHLSDASPSHRVRCVETLGRMGHEAAGAVPALFTKLKKVSRDDDAFFRKLVATIGRIGPAANPCVTLLTDLLEDGFTDNGSNQIDDLITSALTRIGDPPVAFLIRELSSRDRVRQILAAEMFVRVGPAAKSCASKLLAVGREPGLDQDVRTEIAVALAAVDPTSSYTARSLTDAIVEDPRRAVPAIRYLGPYGIVALPQLLKLVDHPDSEVRVEVIKALRLVDPEGQEVVPALVHALGSRDASVRAQAAQAVGEIGPSARESMPLLIARFARPPSNDPEEDPDYRRTLATAIGRVRSHPEIVIPRLLAILNDRRQIELHRDALVALTAYGPAAREAVPYLIQALKGANQDLAADALGRIGGDARQALPALLSALSVNGGPRQAALALAMTRIDPSKIDELDRVVQTVQDPYARAFVFGFMGRESPEGHGVAREVLRSLNEQLQLGHELSGTGADPLAYTISRLGRLGPSAASAIPKLTALLSHWDPKIRREARTALALIERTTPP